MDTSKGSDGDTAGVCRRTASGFPRAAHGRTAARDRHVPPVGRLPAVRTGLRPSALGRYKADRANVHPGDRAADDRGRADRPADGREPSPQGPHALQDAAAIANLRDAVAAERDWPTTPRGDPPRRTVRLAATAAARDAFRPSGQPPRCWVLVPPVLPA